jgi:hypothetical protein
MLNGKTLKQDLKKVLTIPCMVNTILNNLYYVKATIDSANAYVKVYLKELRWLLSL